MVRVTGTRGILSRIWDLRGGHRESGPYRRVRLGDEEDGLTSLWGLSRVRWTRTVPRFRAQAVLKSDLAHRARISMLDYEKNYRTLELD